MKKWTKENVNAMLVEMYTTQNTLKDDVGNMQSDIKNIKENHLFHIETDMSGVKKDIKWIIESYKKLDKKFWGVLIVGISSLIGIVINTYLTFN